MPDAVYRQARMIAAERDTSISALVRDFLAELSMESDAERGKRLQKEVLASIRSFRAGDRLKRGEVHDRRALR